MSGTVISRSYQPSQPAYLSSIAPPACVRHRAPAVADARFHFHGLVRLAMVDQPQAQAGADRHQLRLEQAAVPGVAAKFAVESVRPSSHSP